VYSAERHTCKRYRFDVHVLCNNGHLAVWPLKMNGEHYRGDGAECKFQHARSREDPTDVLHCLNKKTRTQPPLTVSATSCLPAGLPTGPQQKQKQQQNYHGLPACLPDITADLLPG